MNAAVQEGSTATEPDRMYFCCLLLQVTAALSWLSACAHGCCSRTTQQQQAFEAFAAWRCVATKHASYVQLQHQTGSSPVLEACTSASKVVQAVCFGS